MRYLLLSIFSIVSAFAVNAQTLGTFSINSSNRQLIEDAVSDGLFIVRRSYQLIDTTAQPPVYYGWNNAEHFGHSLSLGIKAENGYYLAPQAVFPWKYDSRFAEYNNSRKYEPVISESRYKLLSESEIHVLPSENTEPKAMANNRFYFVRDSLFDNQGFLTDDSNGTKKGWLVWVVAADSLINETDNQFSLLIYRNELTFEAGKNACPLKEPATGKAILGGLYIVPHFDGIGKIDFRLSGLLNQKDGQWQVERLNETLENPAPQPQSQPDKKGLTPIKKKK